MIQWDWSSIASKKVSSLLIINLHKSMCYVLYTFVIVIASVVCKRRKTNLMRKILRLVIPGAYSMESFAKEE